MRSLFYLFSEVEELADLIANIDWIMGAAFAGLWILSNGAVLLLFDHMYEGWKDVFFFFCAQGSVCFLEKIGGDVSDDIGKTA